MGHQRMVSEQYREPPFVRAYPTLLLVPLALSVAQGDSRLLGYTELLVRFTLSAPGVSMLLTYTGNLPFYALSTTLRVREGFIGKISFTPVPRPWIWWWGSSQRAASHHYSATCSSRPV
jgi:hypothetical protein